MNPKEKAYQQAIDLLTGNNGEVDFRSIVITLAKQYPEVLVAIVNGKPVEQDTETPEWAKTTNFGWISAKEILQDFCRKQNK